MKTNERFSKTTLRNGMRVISEYIPSVRSVSIGIWVQVGSRDETPALNGVSHFIEHMHFKGTKRRSAYQIAQFLEALGGSINAFTSREETCFHARILNKHLPQAVDLLGDILNNSTFTPANIAKEKQVIAEEIKDIMDTPNEYVHDLFGSQMWDGHPLGQPIMGKRENIVALKRKAVLQYIEDHYQAPNVVVAAAGDLSHRHLVELVKRYFPWTATRYQKDNLLPKHNGFSMKTYPSRTKQTQVCLGFPSISFADEDRYPLMVANAILSGGMSSRLFQSVREKAGYCYSIYSFQEFFRDAGLFCVYFAADGKHVARATELVLKELRRLKESALTKTELKEIKEQLKGSLMLSQESTYNRMNRIARMELMLGEYVNLDETIRSIDAVTSQQVSNVCRHVFDGNCLTFTALGPIKKKELDKIDWYV